MDTGRRNAMKVIGAAALAAGTAPLLGACAGAARPSAAGRDAGVPGLEPALEDALRLASLAPSGHNAQPWTVRVPESNRLVIGTARDRWLPAVDPGNRELLLSLGCFLENLVVSAGHLGLELDYRVVAATPGDREVLEVTVRRATPSPFPLDRILTRRTVRSGHLAQELRSADVHGLCAPFGGRLAFFPPGSSSARWLSESTLEANRAQADREPAQEELSRWVRWSDDDALRQRNGLTPESMEITGIAGWYVRHFMDRSSVMGRRFRDRGVDAVRAQLGSYGGWLVMTSPDGSVSTLLETGRLFERMWLGCRQKMIAIHPMTQILEEAPFRDQVARQLGVSGAVQFIVRASYLARYPDPVSLRMPVSRFVTDLSAKPAPAVGRD